MSPGKGSPAWTRLLTLIAAACSLLTLGCTPIRQDAQAPGEDDGHFIAVDGTLGTGEDPCPPGARGTGGSGVRCGRGTGEDPYDEVTPTDGLAQLRPVSWDTYVARGSAAVVVKWNSGADPCHVFSHAVVEETVDRITVTVFEGSRSGHSTRGCVELSSSRGYTIQLDSPIDNRTIVDGAVES